MGRWRRVGGVRWIVTALVVVAAAVPAVAEPPPRFAVSAGGFDVVEGEESAEAGFEVRFAPRRFQLVPVLGGTVNSDGGFYLLAGLRRDLAAGARWVVTPHFGVTLLDEGDGKELGSAVEFRSGLEIAYRLGGSSRLGLSFYHLSNAGISETNPGSESLVLVYSFGG